MKQDVQTPPPFGHRAGQVQGILQGMAKTGGADHGAVAAIQAAGRHLIPAGMFIVAVEQFFDPGGVQHPAHIPGDGRHHPGRGVNLSGWSAILWGTCPDDLGPPVGADLHHEEMLIALEHLRQGQVKPRGGPGPGPHGDAETRALVLVGAVQRHDEGLLPAGFVGGIDMGALEKDPVLHGHGLEFTGPDPDEGEFGDRLGLGDDAPTTALPLGLPQGLVRRQEKLLPGLLPHGEAEPGLIRPFFQAKGPALLERGPAYGEIRNFADLPIDQLAVFQGGAHHLIAPAGQGVQQVLKIPGRQPHPRPDL